MNTFKRVLEILGSLLVLIVGVIVLSTPYVIKETETEYVYVEVPVVQNDRVVELENELELANNTITDLKQQLKSLKKKYKEVSNIITYTHLDVETQIYAYAMCLEYGVDYELFLAVMHNESSSNPTATNRNSNGTTDSGLMQINSVNHDWLTSELGVTDFYNPFQNMRAGAFMLGELSKKYADAHQILMAYNMGEVRTKQLNNQGIYSSKYSRKVMEYVENLK